MIRGTLICRLDQLGGTELVETNDNHNIPELVEVKRKTKKALRTIDIQTPEQLVIKDREQNPTYLTNILVSNKTVYVAITDASFPAKLAFAYLQEVRNKFSDIYPEHTYLNTQLRPFQFQSFDTQIQEIAQKNYSNPRGFDAIRGQLDEVKDIMYTNIEAAIERGTALSELSNKSQNLKDASLKYRKAAVRMNWELLFKQYGPVGGLAFMMIVFVWWRFF